MRYWDGACKVKRKYKHNGEYKEERKCKDEPQPVYVAPQPAYVAPQPVYVPAPAPAPRPGVTIQGNSATFSVSAGGDLPLDVGI